MTHGTYISSDWKYWIAENILRGARDEDLLKILVENGFSSELANLELATATVHPYLAAASSISRQLSKRDWVLHMQRSLREQVADHMSVFDNLDGDTFHREFYAHNRPVILKRCIDDWKAPIEWTSDVLRERYGSIDVQVQFDRDANERYEQQPDQHRKTMLFAELVDLCFDDSTGNNVYMTARNGDANGDILSAVKPDLGSLEQYLTEEPNDDEGQFLWFGPAGTLTPLHHDMTNNLLVQLMGEKRIDLVSPDSLPYVYNRLHCYSDLTLTESDAAEFPLSQLLTVTTVEIGAGDILFLPVGWWHQVRSLSTSITLACTNFRWPNDFGEHYNTYGEI